MSSSYTGVPANVPAGAAPTITIPVDGDTANVASVNSAFQKLCDAVAQALVNGAFVGANNTFAGSQTFNAAVTMAALLTLSQTDLKLTAAAVQQILKTGGILKLGTTWPLPKGLLEKHLALTDRILIVEEVLPFLEENVHALAAILVPRVGIKTFHGKLDGSIPMINEMNPDLVLAALTGILKLKYHAVPDSYAKSAEEISVMGAPARAQTFCPGCPHRASFWSVHNALKLDHRDGFVCGDIGCYSMAAGATGFDTLKTLHSMGSGTGLASGFGKLGRFGLNQPILAVCGDSTFYHAVLPGLVNAIHNRSGITLLVLDNSGTAMTGFQAHPGLEVNALGQGVPAVNIPELCRAMGATVRICDPFDLEGTRTVINELMEEKGVVSLAEDGRTWEVTLTDEVAGDPAEVN